MTKAELDAIRARCDAAIEAPWAYHYYDGDMTVYQGLSKTPSGRFYYKGVICNMDDPDASDYSIKQLMDTAEFIAHARQDIPALLHALDEATTALEAWVSLR